MYIKQILTQENSIRLNAFLYERLDKTASKTMRLWESAGLKLKEAALTREQIAQLFQQIEQDAIASGTNRTAIGKGKDAASAVNQAWEDLKTKVQNSGPIKNVDEKYDNIVSKIEASLGGPNNSLSKIVQKYRTFAKEHPIAQGFVYAALIAAAGISGAGLGGAATLGLLKTADKLLQGEKFSSAAYQGTKTGALAYGASKVGDYARSNTQSSSPGVPNANSVTTTPAYPAELTAPQDAADIKAATEYSVADATEKQEIRKVTGLSDQQLKNIHTQQSSQFDQPVTAKQVTPTAEPVSMDDSDLLDRATSKLLRGDSLTPEETAILNKEKIGTDALTGLRPTESLTRVGKKLSESQIKSLFYILNGVPSRKIIKEGPMDVMKSAIGKGASKLKTAGRNLTNKITTDKLMAAWEAAGRPTQDTAIANMLRDAGVSNEAISSAFSVLKLTPTNGTAMPTLGAQQTNAIGSVANQLGNKSTSAPTTTPPGRVYKAKQPPATTQTTPAPVQTPVTPTPAPVQTPAVAPQGSTVSLSSSAGTIVPFTKTDAGWAAYAGTPKQKVYTPDNPNFAKIEKQWAATSKTAVSKTQPAPAPVTGTIFDAPEKLLSDFNTFVASGKVSPQFKNALKDAMIAVGFNVTESKINKSNKMVKEGLSSSKTKKLKTRKK